jgi:hypothetical protein
MLAAIKEMVNLNAKKKAGLAPPPVRLVQPKFQLQCRSELEEGIFARLDDSLDAAIFELSSATADSGDQILQEFYLWCRPKLQADLYANMQKFYLGRIRRGIAREAKFLSFLYYTRNKINHIKRLKLHKIPPMFVLDIGTGPGHFQFMARFFGHQADGLDLPMPADHVYNALCDFFRVPKVDYRIEPFTRLPDFGRRYDLVTALIPEFNNVKGTPWDEPRWRFFVEDMLENVVRPGGALYLSLSNAMTTPENWAYLSSVAEWTAKGHVALIRKPCPSSPRRSMP